MLQRVELEEVKEAFGMTVLGEMIWNDGKEVGLEAGLKALVETCQDLKVLPEDAIKRVMEKFSLSQEKAEESVKKYWKD